MCLHSLLHSFSNSPVVDATFHPILVMRQLRFSCSNLLQAMQQMSDRAETHVYVTLLPYCFEPYEILLCYNCLFSMVQGNKTIIMTCNTSEAFVCVFWSMKAPGLRRSVSIVPWVVDVEGALKDGIERPPALGRKGSLAESNLHLDQSTQWCVLDLGYLVEPNAHTCSGIG